MLDFAVHIIGVVWAEVLREPAMPRARFLLVNVWAHSSYSLATRSFMVTSSMLVPVTTNANAALPLLKENFGISPFICCFFIREAERKQRTLV